MKFKGCEKIVLGYKKILGGKLKGPMKHPKGITQEKNLQRAEKGV